MRTIRLRFTKTSEAAYISHLDLQRVMARALRRSGLPVWYSQGFNPHIYLSFALPLPLMQESEVEAVDFKTEAEDESFASYILPLNRALPKGITALSIMPPVHTSAEIAYAEYLFFYDAQMCEIEHWAKEYARLPQANVVRRTKRNEQVEDLKMHVPSLDVDEGCNALRIILPAGNPININPELLADFLQESLVGAKAPARILRSQIFTNQYDVFV